MLNNYQILLIIWTFNIFCVIFILYGHFINKDQSSSNTDTTPTDQSKGKEESTSTEKEEPTFINKIKNYIKGSKGSKGSDCKNQCSVVCGRGIPCPPPECEDCLC